jgi:hypothetical protein
MTLAEIKAAHAQGQTVHWMNEGYTVTGKDPENLSITFLTNQHSIGLTRRDGTTLNGKESEFYTSPNLETV